MTVTSSPLATLRQMVALLEGERQALAALDSQQVILPSTLLAEDGGIFGIVATVIVAGLGLFVLNFIKDAAFECAPASSSSAACRRAKASTTSSRWPVRSSFWAIC